VNEWDRFSRDGFKMSDTWQQDAVQSFNGGHPNEFAHGAGHSGSFSGNVNEGLPHYGGDGGMHSGGVHHGSGQAFDQGWWNAEAQAGAMS
jgi:hypothetical protein